MRILGRVLSTAGILAILIFTECAGWAQSGGTGALTANVTDSSGAVIPGASVTVSNAATGLTRTQITEANGSSTFTLLPPGNYNVSISASGFGKVDVPAVTVDVTETRVLTQSLTVGAQTQQVTVEAAAQQVQTENATLGGVVTNREISDLPLVTRNFTQIMVLSAGISASVTNAAALGRGFGSIYSNGQNDISSAR